MNKFEETKAKTSEEEAREIYCGTTISQSRSSWARINFDRGKSVTFSKHKNLDSRLSL